MKPYFSIVVPLYNKERHIKATIESVLAQRFKDFEIIVINDGSTDNSLDLINTITDFRLHIVSIENQGVSHARNYGSKLAKADLLCFLDADDIWHPNHLEDIKTMYLEHPNCGLYCKAYNKKTKGQIYSSHYNTSIEANKFKVLEDYFDATRIDSIANSSSIMIPKPIYDNLGGFDTTINSGEDTDMWIRLALHYDVCFYNKVSVTINQDADNRLSEHHIDHRRLMDLDKFVAMEKGHPSFHRYLDLNRFSLGIQSKIDGEMELAEQYFSKISPRHLSTKQRFLMHSPRGIVLALKQIQNHLRKFNIDLSSYR